MNDMAVCLQRRCVMVMVLLLGIWTLPVQAESSSAAAETALERELQRLLADHASASSDAHALVGLADLYLDLGDVYQEDAKRRAAYEEGARLAQRAVAIDASNADAHYLYAANLGSATQLKGAMASALVINDLKAHVRQALALKPDHAPALHMMGMMLEELPWFLGGDRTTALTYLQQAVAADPHYTHARLDLAKLYMKRRNTEAARKELTTILSAAPSSDCRYQRYCEEARQLLHSIDH